MAETTENFKNITDKILQATTYFDYADWPSVLYPPSEKTSGFFSSSNIFWDNIKSLRSYTDASLSSFQKDKDYNGSTGWEYSIMLAYFNEKFYYSKFQNSKSYEHVSSRHTFEVDSEFNFESQECLDKVRLDDKVVDEVSWPNTEALKKRNSLIQKGLYKPVFVANFHSHPLIQYPKANKNIYTFFSNTDMNSFFDSNMFITGLVTNKLWIACKSNKSSLPSTEDLKEVTNAELYYPDHLDKKAGEIMKKYGIVLYMAKFGESLQRVN